MLEIKTLNLITIIEKKINFNFFCEQNFNASDQKIDVYHIYIYQIDIYWSENEKNLNTRKNLRVEMLYLKYELRQLGFQCTNELHD